MNKLKLSLVLLIVFVLTSCSETKDEDIWVVGTSTDNPPYEQMKEGKIEGFDIDLIIAIGHHLGKNIKFTNMEFNGLLASLVSNNVDMVIAGLTPTLEREKKVDFSIPYSDSKITVLFRNNDNFQTLANLKGKLVGAQLGTTWSAVAHEIAKTYSFNVKDIASNLMLVEELKIGIIDAIFLEEVQARKFIEKNPQLSSFQIDQDSSRYNSFFVIALPKGSKYKADIDRTIKSLRCNGTIEMLYKKWGIIGAD